MYALTWLVTAFPSAAKSLSVSFENTDNEGCGEGSFENPSAAARAERSRAKSPIATAGLGLELSGVLIIPNGMLASENGESGEIGSHDSDIVVIDTALNERQVEQLDQRPEPSNTF